MSGLTHPQRKNIEKAMDCLSLSYSLMLPRDDMGYIDWDNTNTLNIVSEVLSNNRHLCAIYADRCDELLGVVSKVQSERLAKMVEGFKEKTDGN
jgi:Mg2+/Co2+ transporter CorB